MMVAPKICLIGDVVIDITLKNSATETKMRLGGIVHAARALWAMGIPYDILYFAPSYLDEEINSYLVEHGCCAVLKAGNVTGAPYVFLIGEAKEIGDQGYEFILRERISVNYDKSVLDHFSGRAYENLLMISGSYDPREITAYLNGKVHIDIANNVTDLSYLSSFKAKPETIFISTSSGLFKKEFKGDYRTFAELFRPYCETLILKENRGGSRGIVFGNGHNFGAGAQAQPVLHSVGVGDVFDVAYINTLEGAIHHYALTFASWVAAEYAQTTFPDDFKVQVGRLLKTEPKDMLSMGGIIVPWEIRSQINIYIAAPDFDYVDRRPIDQLESALLYHNFAPRRPIKENGQMESNASKERRQELFTCDMALLDDCRILIAVLLFNDPGTLIEIGLAAARGLPTLIYDPYKIADNCMLTEIPILLSDDLDSIITEVFIQSNTRKNGAA